MSEISAIAEGYEALRARLDGSSDDALFRVYMELAPLIGQIQGAVSAARRRAGEVPIEAAEQSLEALKTSTRQVGLDIRLASPAALRMGLESALHHAGEAIHALQEVA